MSNPSVLELCPGCGSLLPATDTGAVHRYMTSSSGCWEVFNHLSQSGLSHPLLIDAFAAQHPGTPSSQTIQSVAIHLMVLYGICDQKMPTSQALWIRTRPGRSSRTAKHERFFWLEPPSFTGCLTVAEIAASQAPVERSRLLEAWVQDVWSRWAALHKLQVSLWFKRFVLAEKI
jgi:hypothetical protein